MVLGSALVAGLTTYTLMEKNGVNETVVAVRQEGFAMPTALFDNKPAQPVDLTGAAENSVHAVVHIKSTQLGRTHTVQQMPDLFDFFFGDGMGRQQQVRTQPRVGFGSGVIISKDGYIITNNHVIEGANKITVTTAAGEEYSAKLIGTDSNTDVAVIKINASKLDPATYGNSEQLHVGDLAVAIGNPLGELGGTVTAGIISALDRQLAIDGKSMSLLQTDSSINPGNSGGGLFNDDGQLIGIVVAKSSGSDVEGLGFAIPINTAAKVAQDLMDKGYVSGQPTTGMSYTEGSGHSNGDMDFFFGGYEDTSVYIHAVTGTNARKAGFKAGDMVYSVDGQEITCFDDLSSIVTSHKVGDKLKFTVLRNGEAIDITLELEEKTN
jgi:serine protease Do